MVGGGGEVRKCPKKWSSGLPCWPVVPCGRGNPWRTRVRLISPDLAAPAVALALLEPVGTSLNSWIPRLSLLSQQDPMPVAITQRQAVKHRGLGSGAVHAFWLHVQF